MGIRVCIWENLTVVHKISQILPSNLYSLNCLNIWAPEGFHSSSIKSVAGE